MGAFEGSIWSFSNQSGVGKWNIPRKKVGTDLMRMLLSPDGINQNGFGCCGEVACLRLWSYRAPDDVAKFALALYNNGSAPIAASNYSVSGTPTLYAGQFINATPNSVIGSAVWMIATSLGVTDNNEDPNYNGQPDSVATNAGDIGTVTNNLVPWLNAMGTYASTDPETNTFSTAGGSILTIIIDGLTGLPLPNMIPSKTIDDMIKVKPGPGLDVILLINANMFDGLVSSSPPGLSSKWEGGVSALESNHWVVLVEPIIDLGNGNAAVHLWTWGQSYRVVVPKSTFNTNFYGWIACTGKTKSYQDFTLVTDPTKAVYAILGGAKFHVPDTATLQRLFPYGTPAALAQSDTGAIPTAPRDSSLFVEDNGTLTVVYGGARLQLPNASAVGAVFSGTKIPIWNGGIETLPTVPADSTLFQEQNGTISAIWGGARLQVPDLATALRLYPSTPIWPIWNGALNALPTVPRDQTVLHDEAGNLWVILGGVRYEVPGTINLLQYFPSAKVCPVWNAALNAFPTTPPDETVLSDFTTGEYGDTLPWVIFGGAKFRMNDPATQKQLYPNAPSYSLWPGALNSYPTVPPEGYVLQEQQSLRASQIYKGMRKVAPASLAANAKVIWYEGLSGIAIARTTIQGTVTGPSGPIAGASISLSTDLLDYDADGGANLTTDGNGNYSTSVETGSTTSFTVVASGFDPDTVAATPPDSGVYPFNITLSAPPARIPGATKITGHLYDLNQDPVPSIRLTATPGGQVATSDPSGAYTLVDVAIGVVSVTAVGQGYAQATEAATVSTNKTSVLDFSLAWSAAAPLHPTVPVGGTGKTHTQM